ncbi:MAG TPA: hypothetical protein VMZ53_09175 [Kofleriaceae bacterium]|nr:hypothetical protein [Kofleriaceae bacterium]
MRRPLHFVIASVLLTVAPAAEADSVDFYGTANGSVATTDNVSGLEAGKPGKRGDVFSDIRPGFLVTYYAPRMIHEINTEVDFLYHIFTAKPTVTFRAGWKAFFITSPRSEATINADASKGQLNALSASITPDTSIPTQVLPPGRVDVESVTGSQNLSWVATEGSRIWQRAFGRYGTTLDEVANMDDVTTKSWETGIAFGVDRTYRHNNFLLELGGSYVYMEKLDPSGRQMGSRLDRQWNPRAVVVWQHDITKQWSSNIDAGGVYVMPTGVDPYNPGQERHNGFFPVFGGVAAYTDVWGRAQVAARRQVTPNLFIAQNTLSDSLTLTAAMPLTFFDKDAQKRAPKVVGIGNAGVERTRLIDPVTGGLSSTYHVARIDFGVGWSPRPGQTFGLRYELSYQNGTTTAAEMQVPEFVRNTFYFTFSLRYPEDILVKVPRRGQSVRADKKDLAPIGAEPVIVDPQEFLEGGGR